MLLYIDPACQLIMRVFNCIGNSSTCNAEFVSRLLVYHSWDGLAPRGAVGIVVVMDLRLPCVVCRPPAVLPLIVEYVSHDQSEFHV